MTSSRATVASGLLALLLACRSSAPYTAPAAAINSALGLGVSARQRAAGGCFAMCTNGLECNPRTGYCEPPPCGPCPAGESCILASGGFRCGSGAEASTPGAAIRTDLPPPAQVVPGIGISPRTGGGPPLPHHPGPDQQ
jgi:hypothetical protein